MNAVVKPNSQTEFAWKGTGAEKVHDQHQNTVTSPQYTVSFAVCYTAKGWNDVATVCLMQILVSL